MGILYVYHGHPVLLMFVNLNFMCESTKMSIDLFSDILTFAKARTVLSGSLAAEGDWAVRFRPPSKVKFFAIVKGRCLLTIDNGDYAPIWLNAGDVFMITRDAIVLSSGETVRPVDGTELYANKPEKAAVLGTGEDFLLLGGHIDLDPQPAGFLHDVLPPLIYIPSSSPHASISTWLLNRMVEERNTPQPGHTLAMEQLCQLLFVEMLRAYFLSMDELPIASMLRAVSDRRLAPVLRLIHDNPGHDWGLEELAAAAGMSRTTFASTFKSVAGITPLGYITVWRMRLAERALRDRDISVAELAYSLGYTSESAFSHAFKRIAGQAPTTFRNSARQTQTKEASS